MARAVPNFGDFIATQFLSGQLNAWATCDNIKKAIGHLWHSISVALDGNSKKFLKLDPQSLSFSEVAISGGNLKFVGALSVVASISSKQLGTALKNLPERVSVPSPPKVGAL